HHHSLHSFPTRRSSDLFSQRGAYRSANASTLKLIERFTLKSPKSLEWSLTVDDPTTWTRPWTFAIPLTVNNDERIEQYECHEGKDRKSTRLNSSHDQIS